MLAASSVMAMSGGAMATKKTPRNEKSQGASKDLAWKKTKGKRTKMMAYAFLRVRVCLRTGNNEYKAMKPKNEVQKYYKSDIIGTNAV